MTATTRVAWLIRWRDRRGVMERRVVASDELGAWHSAVKLRANRRHPLPPLDECVIVRHHLRETDRKKGPRVFAVAPKIEIERTPPKLVPVSRAERRGMRP